MYPTIGTISKNNHTGIKDNFDGERILRSPSFII